MHEFLIIISFFKPKTITVQTKKLRKVKTTGITSPNKKEKTKRKKLNTKPNLCKSCGLKTKVIVS